MKSLSSLISSQNLSRHDKRAAGSGSTLPVTDYHYQATAEAPATGLAVRRSPADLKAELRRFRQLSATFAGTESRWQFAIETGGTGPDRGDRRLAAGLAAHRPRANRPWLTPFAGRAALSGRAIVEATQCCAALTPAKISSRPGNGQPSRPVLPGRGADRCRDGAEHRLCPSDGRGRLVAQA